MGWIDTDCAHVARGDGFADHAHVLGAGARAREPAATDRSPVLPRRVRRPPSRSESWRRSCSAASRPRRPRTARRRGLRSSTSSPRRRSRLGRRGCAGPADPRDRGRGGADGQDRRLALIVVVGAGAMLANPGGFIPIALKTISETEPEHGALRREWLFFTVMALLPLMSRLSRCSSPATGRTVLGRLRDWLEAHARTIPSTAPARSGAPAQRNLRPHELAACWNFESDFTGGVLERPMIGSTAGWLPSNCRSVTSECA